MQTRHPLRAAMFAAVIPLVAVAVFGNSWFTEHVRNKGHSPRVDRLVTTVAPFPWTFTPRHGRGFGTIWAAQVVGIVIVVVGVFLVVWAVARHATGFSLFLGAWGVTVLVAMVGAFVFVFISYGVLIGGAGAEALGRFWYSVYQSQEVTLWGAAVGFAVGLIAALLVGGVDNRPEYVTSAPLAGSAPVWQPVPETAAAPAWSTQPYVTDPVTTAPPTATYPVFEPSTPPPAPRPHGDPTVVMVQPTDWESPAPPPPPPPSTSPPPTPPADES